MTRHWDNIDEEAFREGESLEASAKYRIHKRRWSHKGTRQAKREQTRSAGRHKNLIEDKDLIYWKPI